MCVCLPLNPISPATHPTKLLAESVVGATAAAEEEEEEEEADATAKAAQERYTVVGTLSRAGAAAPKHVSEVVSKSDKDAVHTALLGATHVVYNIMDDAQAAAQALDYLVSQSTTFETPKTVVFLSNFMTWAKTKPIDPEDPEARISEEEYKRRIPHNAYRTHTDVEKALVKAAKDTAGKIASYVIASGIVYGHGEDVLHALFKTAWLLKSPSLPVIGDGSNVIPMIHLSDLAAIVLRVLDSKPA